LLGLSLVLTLGVAAWMHWFSGDTEEGVVEPQERVFGQRSSLSSERNTAAARAESSALPVERLRRPTAGVGDAAAGNAANPFEVKSWYVPPPPPPPAPPPEPQAPELPFKYMGKLEEGGGRVMYYLAKGNEFFVVAKGETFDQNYRFLGVKNGKLEILYLPLSIKQTLAVGDDP